jgi:hypothetical protein
VFDIHCKLVKLVKNDHVVLWSTANVIEKGFNFETNDFLLADLWHLIQTILV